MADLKIKKKSYKTSGSVWQTGRFKLNRRALVDKKPANKSYEHHTC